MTRNDVQFKLRLPPDVRERIRELAFENRRSMTAEIVYQLEQVCAAEQTKTATEGQIGVSTSAAAQT